MAQYKWTPFTRSAQGEAVDDPAAREAQGWQQLHQAQRASEAKLALQRQLREDQLQAQQQEATENRRRYNDLQNQRAEAFEYQKSQDVISQENFLSQLAERSRQSSFRERQAERDETNRQADITRQEGYRQQQRDWELEDIEAKGIQSRKDYTWQQEQEELLRPGLEAREIAKEDRKHARDMERIGETDRLAADRMRRNNEERDRKAADIASAKEEKTLNLEWERSDARKDLTAGLGNLESQQLVNTIREVGYKTKEGGHLKGSAGQKAIQDVDVAIEKALAEKRDTLLAAQKKALEKEKDRLPGPVWSEIYNYLKAVGTAIKEYAAPVVGAIGAGAGSVGGPPGIAAGGAAGYKSAEFAGEFIEDFFSNEDMNTMFMADPEYAAALDDYEKFKEDLRHSLDSIPQLGNSKKYQILTGQNKHA